MVDRSKLSLTKNTLFYHTKRKHTHIQKLNETFCVDFFGFIIIVVRLGFNFVFFAHQALEQGERH